MNQREVKDTLTRLHFVGRWTIKPLAKESGLSTDTIRKAMGGFMTPRTQTRLEMLFRQIPETYDRPAPKHKPGKRKRSMIRYYNLREWIQTLEEQPEGRNHDFVLKNRYDMRTNEAAGYICTKLDFILKWYLLRAFGPELQKKKIYMGDCYPAEQWIDRIEKKLPNYKRDLVRRLQHRKGLTQ